jgi:hypothetical protein
VPCGGLPIPFACGIQMLARAINEIKLFLEADEILTRNTLFASRWSFCADFVLHTTTS